MIPKSTKVSIKKPGLFYEVLIILAVAIVTYAVSRHYDTFETIISFLQVDENGELDEIIIVFIVLFFCLLIFSFRRWVETVHSMRELEQEKSSTPESP